MPRDANSFVQSDGHGKFLPDKNAQPICLNLFFYLESFLFLLLCIERVYILGLNIAVFHVFFMNLLPV